MQRKVVIFSREKAEEAARSYSTNLDALEELYASTGNPIFVWEALAVVNVLRHASKRGLPVPEVPALPAWTLDYLLQSASGIAKLANDSVTPGSNPAARIPHALGLMDGSTTNRFVEYRRLRRSVDLEDLRQRQRAEGIRGDAAKEQIKKTFGPRDITTTSRARKTGAAVRELIDERLSVTRRTLPKD